MTEHAKQAIRTITAEVQLTKTGFVRALIPEIEERTVATFEEADLEDGWEPERAELIRPSATWTYLVNDNPFGSELERLISMVRSRKTR